MERQYIMSERAHFMCPNMNFGMLIELAGAYDGERFSAALDRLAQAHPFLRAVIAGEEGSDRLFYDVSDESRISPEVTDGKFDISEYESLMKKPRNIFEEGLLEVRVYKSPDSFEVLLFEHHLLTDGRGLLQLAEELADSYAEDRPVKYAEERLIADVSELPAGSELSGVSRLLVRRVNKQWKKEDHRVSYEEYADFVSRYNAKHRLEYKRYEVDDAEYQEMRKQCRDNGFTINDLLMAKMYIRTGAEKIIIAADIRDKLNIYNEGALGNYATAMGIVCRSKTADEVKKAGEVHKLVQKAIRDNRRLMQVLACYFAMEPTLLDAAAISGLGGFESRAASFVGGGMFGFAEPASYSITNLGKIENRNILSAVFLPPASPAAKLTLGVVTVNGKMSGCSSRCI